MSSFSSIPFIITGALIALSILIHPVHAYPYCINGTWLGESVDIGVNGINTHLSIPTYCKYGCDSKLLQCNPSDWEALTGPVGSNGLFIMIAAMITVVIGLMYFASKR